MVSAVIAEFNIFHNGHKYLIDEARRQSDAVIAIMSGSFVQRGDVAAADKWTRAKTALMCGVDLVLELPVCGALNAAPNFARSAIGTLHALGIADTLFFGSENGGTDALARSAYTLENETAKSSDKIKTLLSRGMSYPAALSKAYDGKIDSDLLRLPNNILAIEYIRALIRSGSNIKPFAVRRRGASHNGDDIENGFASASKIREMLTRGEDVSALVPYNLSEAGITRPFLLSRLDCAVTARLRTITAEELGNISEVSEGIENRIIRAGMERDSFEAIASAAKSKRYTLSKIRRILIAALLGFTKDVYTGQTEYIRVLGMNRCGAALLHEAKGKCAVPIITKTADYKGSSRQLALDIRATDIAMLCNPNRDKRYGGADFKQSPVIFD